MLICSRQFSLDDGKASALVPFADMLNHAGDDKNIFWESYRDKQNRLCYRMIAHKDIKRGEELFDTYGNRCNWEYFYPFGFVLRNNKYNESIFNLPLRDDDPLLEQKKEMIGA